MGGVSSIYIASKVDSRPVRYGRIGARLRFVALRFVERCMFGTPLGTFGAKRPEIEGRRGGLVTCAVSTLMFLLLMAQRAAHRGASIPNFECRGMGGGLERNGIYGG